MYSAIDRIFLLKALWRKYGWRSLVRQFRPHEWRAHSRTLLQTYIDQTRGIEIGVGAQTISPVKYTLFTDGFKQHAAHASLATEFFPADKIPYPDQTFSFLVSEHVLEHVSNPLETVQEWKRVLKKNGILFLVLPHPERTFDQGRPYTEMTQLTSGTRNDDQIFEEWKKNVLERGRAPHYAQLSKEEALKTNSLHRNVWNETLMSELLIHLGFTVLYTEAQLKDRGDSFLVIARA